MPTRWGERDRRRPELVDLLQAAVIHRRKVRLSYADRTPSTDAAAGRPVGSGRKDDIWYLLAGTERGQRTFRVDRIIGAEATDQPAERPDDFTLAAAWQQVVGEVEQRRSRTWATVLVKARFVPVLRGQFGRHCHTDGELDHARRARVRLAAPDAAGHRPASRRLGALIEVVEPPSVQGALARIGAELAGRYTSRH